MGSIVGRYLARMLRLRRLIATIAMDVGPLRRHRDFRLLFTGQIVTFLGSMVTYVALPYQAYQLSGSALIVGLLGIAEFAPLIAAALLGGALADAHDRRRMLQLTELGFAAATGVLVINALSPDPQLWVLFVVASVMATIDGLQRPSLEALTPRLVERDELPAASALSSFRMNVGMVVGPALGGVLIAVIGLPLTYVLDVATFLFSLAMLRMMRAVPPPADAARPSLRGIVEGIRYAAGRPELVGTYAVETAPDGIVFDGRSIWVANSGSNTVSELDYMSGQLIGSYPVGKNPASVCFDGNAIWIANKSSNSLGRR